VAKKSVNSFVIEVLIYCSSKHTSMSSESFCPQATGVPAMVVSKPTPSSRRTGAGPPFPLQQCVSPSAELVALGELVEAQASTGAPDAAALIEELSCLVGDRRELLLHALVELGHRPAAVANRGWRAADTWVRRRWIDAPVYLLVANERGQSLARCEPCLPMPASAGSCGRAFARDGCRGCDLPPLWSRALLGVEPPRPDTFFRA